jgi:hypothetical protein
LGVAAPTDDATVANVHLRLVPDTPQTEKFQQNIVRNWRRLIDLTNEPAAVPQRILSGRSCRTVCDQSVSGALGEIAQLMGRPRLLTGDVRASGDGGFSAGLHFFDSQTGICKFPMSSSGAVWRNTSRLARAGAWHHESPRMKGSSGTRTADFDCARCASRGPSSVRSDLLPHGRRGRAGWSTSPTIHGSTNAGPMQHLLIARVAIEEDLPSLAR